MRPVPPCRPVLLWKLPGPRSLSSLSSSPPGHAGPSPLPPAIPALDATHPRDPKGDSERVFGPYARRIGCCEACRDPVEAPWPSFAPSLPALPGSTPPRHSGSGGRETVNKAASRKTSPLRTTSVVSEEKKKNPDGLVLQHIFTITLPLLAICGVGSQLGWWLATATCHCCWQITHSMSRPNLPYPLSPAGGQFAVLPITTATVPPLTIVT